MNYPRGSGEGEDFFTGSGELRYHIDPNKLPLMEYHYFGNGSYWFETDMQGNGDHQYPHNQLTKVNKT
jgi:hypothetical protein